MTTEKFTSRARATPRQFRPTRNLVRIALACLCFSGHGLCANGPGSPAPRDNPSDLYVQVSPNDSHYFQWSDGRPYIPIGLNLAGPGFDPAVAPETRLAQMESWMKSLAKNRGNFIRIWLGQDYFDVEHAQLGKYDEQKLQRIEHVLRLARELGLRVKLCLEQFRNIDPERFAKSGPIFSKPLYHVSQGGQWNDMQDFLVSDSGRAQFRNKLDWYRARIGDNPTIFAWELWNEMDAVGAPVPAWSGWTKEMILALRKRFPRNLVTQSWGSFDQAIKQDELRWLAGLPYNDIVQVHRYIDQGAGLEVCHGAMDVLAADAVSTMRSFNVNKPVLLAETGGVQPKHAGPFDYYGADHAGIILHDALFAAFFAGAAGPGHIWHWDDYVDRNQLWHHFDRFAEAVKGIDPAREGFVPRSSGNSRLRTYVLAGGQTTLIWCRDAANTWESELRDGVAPQPVTGVSLDLSPYCSANDDLKVEFYDPWTNTWRKGRSTDRRVTLPEFTRSLVVRITHASGL